MKNVLENNLMSRKSKTYKERLVYENEASKRRSKKTRERIQQYKRKPCIDCGIEYPPYVMDFDHVRGEKLGTISQMIGVPKDKLEAEINKCEVVCANCHRERTHQRKLQDTMSENVLYL